MRLRSDVRNPLYPITLGAGKSLRSCFSPCLSVTSNHAQVENQQANCVLVARGIPGIPETRPGVEARFTRRSGSRSGDAFVPEFRRFENPDRRPRPSWRAETIENDRVLVSALEYPPEKARLRGGRRSRREPVSTMKIPCLQGIPVRGFGDV